MKVLWLVSITIPAAASNIQLLAASGTIEGLSNTFSVTDPPSFSVSLPASASESAGTMAGTVALNAPLGTPAVVDLASSDITAAVPSTATVTIPAGATTASFQLNIIDDSLQDGAQPATITASASGIVSGSAVISVKDDELHHFSFNTIASPQSTGGLFPVTIHARTLDNQPAAAFDGGTAALAVEIAGSPSVITPAATGAFAAGSWSGNVSLAGLGSAVITATSGTSTGSSNAFTLTAPAISVSLPISAGESAGSAAGTVSLSAPLQTAITVGLSSSDTTEAAPAAASIDIPAGSISAGFTLSIINDTLQDGAQPATITASSPGLTSGSAAISIMDDELHHFEVSPVASPQIRNAPFNVGFFAKAIDGSTIASYGGSPVLTGADGGSALAVSPPALGGFAAGEKTAAVTVADFAANAVLTVTDTAAGVSGSGNTFEVTHGPAMQFAWSTAPSPQVAGVPFPVTIQAKDDFGNTVPAYTGTASLAASTGGSSTRMVGDGSTTNVMPFNTIFTKCRTQEVHLAGEVGGSTVISSLAINLTAVPLTVTLTDFTIRMKHTTRTGYSGSSDYIWESSGFTTVYQGNPTLSTAGYVTFNFTTPFAYDGASNLMVDFSYRSSSTTANRPTAAATARSGSRVIKYYTSSATYGDPLAWTGTTPVAFPENRITDLRLGVDTALPLTPAVTTAFINGSWSGSVTVGAPATSTAVIAVDGPLNGASNIFEVLGSQLAIVPEPPFTGGTSNTLSWNQPAAGLEYELQRSLTDDFSSPASTGFITGSSSVQSGLLDGQAYYYRLRMRRPGANAWTGSWLPPVASTQDATPPVIAASHLTTSAASAALAGTASDAASGIATVLVAGNAASTSDQFASWTSPLSGLSNGPNSITVSASDQAVPPNTATVTAMVFRIADPASDTDGNGLSDLLEHALVIPAGDPNGRSMLPIASMQTDSGTGQRFLTLEYRRRIQRAGLVYTVETSHDLAGWASAGGDVMELSVTPVGDGVTETVRVRITPAVDSTACKFVRLNVTVQ